MHMIFRRNVVIGCFIGTLASACGGGGGSESGNALVDPDSITPVEPQLPTPTATGLDRLLGRITFDYNFSITDPDSFTQIVDFDSTSYSDSRDVLVAPASNLFRTQMGCSELSVGFEFLCISQIQLVSA